MWEISLLVFFLHAAGAKPLIHCYFALITW